MPVALIAAFAALLVAPGKVVLPDAGFRVERNPDTPRGAVALMQPDGRAVVVDGGALVRIGRTGAVESRTPMRLPAGARPQQLLRGPGGRLLVVATAPARSRYETEQLQVVDPATGAVGRPGIQIGCGAACEIASVAPDGSVFVAGATGQVDPSIETNPQAPNSYRWVVAKLTPQLKLDGAFGSGGLAGFDVVSARGFAVSVLPDGRIVTSAQTSSWRNFNMWLARLLPDGRPDPSFNAGRPVATDTGAAFAWAVHPDGAVDLMGAPRTLARFAADGSVAAMHDLGDVQVVRLHPEPGGGVVALARANVPGPFPAAVRLAALRPGHPAAYADLAFGGGFGGSVRANSLGFSDVLRRPDGSFLVVGGVGVARYTGEGAGLSVDATAFASLTPQLRLEAAFGGAATKPTLQVSVPRQRAGRRAIRVRAIASTPGLVELRLRMNGRAITTVVVSQLRRVEHHTVRVPARHRRGLSAGRRVVVSARMRDLLTGAASDSARGRLG